MTCGFVLAHRTADRREEPRAPAHTGLGRPLEPRGLRVRCLLAQGGRTRRAGESRCSSSRTSPSTAGAAGLVRVRAAPQAPASQSRAAGDRGISGEYAEIIARGGTFVLQPLRSRNPSLLKGDGVPEEGALLQNEECIGMGSRASIFWRFRRADATPPLLSGLPEKVRSYHAALGEGEAVASP